MEYPRPTIKINDREFELISFDEFRDRRGLILLSNQTIGNHIDKDRLDYVTLGRFRYIVWNNKAKDFNLSYLTPASTSVK